MGADTIKSLSIRCERLTRLNAGTAERRVAYCGPSFVSSYHPSVPGVLVQKIDNGPRTDVADLTTTDYYAPDASCLGAPLGCRNSMGSDTINSTQYHPRGGGVRNGV